MESSPSPSSASSIALRHLRPDDIAFANELRALAGWNQTEHDWRGYLHYEPEGCFVAELGGRRVGTATTIRYGDRFGWIGMVLVHPECRRLGVGTRLLRHGIGWLQERGVRCVKLDATPMGRPVYLPLGFVDEYGLARYQGTAPAGARPADVGVAPMGAADWEEVVRLDATAFGAERPLVLRTLSGRHPELSFVARREGQVLGYVLARQGARAVQVGPWVARDPAVAEPLLQAVFNAVSGRLVFLDVIDPNPVALAMVVRYGFTVQRTLTRMYLGTNAHPGEPGWVYGISSPEKG